MLTERRSSETRCVGFALMSSPTATPATPSAITFLTVCGHPWTRFSAGKGWTLANEWSKLSREGTAFPRPECWLFPQAEKLAEQRVTRARYCEIGGRFDRAGP